MANGQYGEGNVQLILNQLQDLKSQVQSGKLNLTDYQSQAEPLVKQATTYVQQIAGQGSKAASAVNPIWSQLQQQGFVTANGGKWVPQLPFSQQEYARLPDTVLPTQSDIDKGLFNPSQAPMNRIQQPTPAVNPGPTTTPGVTNPTTNQSTKDILDIVKGTNGPSDLTTDQGKLQNQGDINATQLAETLALQQQLKGQAVKDEGTAYTGIDQQRQKNLSDLADLLTKNQMDQFNRAVPDLAEQANTSGILRSTGFGDILARKYADLGKDTSTQLALQGLNDRATALGEQTGMVGQNYTNATDYANGLTDVVNTKIGADNAGLQRSFSLQDYQNQLADALKYGQAPATPSSKTATGAGAVLGAGVGGLLGGPTGATAGGGAGALAGSGVKK